MEALAQSKNWGGVLAVCMAIPLKYSLPYWRSIFASGWSPSTSDGLRLWPKIQEYVGRLATEAPTSPAVAALDGSKRPDLQLKHPGMVRRVAFSPDGSRIATACQDGIVRLWDSRSGQLIFQSVNVENIVDHVIFSPDGKMLMGATLATAGGNATITVWDIASQRIQFATHVGGAMMFSSEHTVLFGPTGDEVFAFVSGRGTGVEALRCCSKSWNLATGKVGHETTAYFFILSCAMSRDCSRLAGRPISGKEGVVIWDVSKGAEIAKIPSTSPATSKGFAFSPNGDMLIWCTERQAFVHDARTGAPVCRPLPLEDEGMLTSFSPQGNVVVVGTRKGINLWSVPSGKPIGHPIDCGGSITGLSFSADGTCVAASSQEGNMGRVWNAETGEPLTPPLAHHGWVHGISLSPDGRRAVTAGHDDLAAVWSVPSNPMSVWPAQIAAGELVGMRAEFANSGMPQDSSLAIDALQMIVELRQAKI